MPARCLFDRPSCDGQVAFELVVFRYCRLCELICGRGSPLFPAVRPIKLEVLSGPLRPLSSATHTNDCSMMMYLLYMTPSSSSQGLICHLRYQEPARTCRLSDDMLVCLVFIVTDVC